MLFASITLIKVMSTKDINSTLAFYDDILNIWLTLDSEIRDIVACSLGGLIFHDALYISSSTDLSISAILVISSFNYKISHRFY